MGHRKHSIPRKGGHGVWPRKRSREWIPRIKTYPPYEGPPRLMGFLAYKAGMTAMTELITDKKDPFFGRETLFPVTILEAPPVVILGLLAYQKTPLGLKRITEVIAYEFANEEFLLHLARTITLPRDLKKRVEKILKEKNIKKDEKEEEEKEEEEEPHVSFAEMMKNRLQKLRELKDKIDEVRVLIAAQPWLTGGVTKKGCDLLELKVGGNPAEALEYAASLLGKEVHITDVFDGVEYVDVIGVTTGKGTEGPVKRHHIKILHRKARKGKRRVGSLGGWTPASVTYRTPSMGQLGFFRRTILNLKVVKVVKFKLENKTKEEKVTESLRKKEKMGPARIPNILPNPPEGHHRYGLVRNDYIVIRGSVMGPPKRPIVIRMAVRKPIGGGRK
ncbi:MAG: 50S ribosomal protein L3 [Candidatus Korarchaeota archaeon]